MQRQILSELLLVWLGNTQYAINCVCNKLYKKQFWYFFVFVLGCHVVVKKNVMHGLNLLDLLEIRSF